MAYDEKVAERLSKVFGGIAFMYKDHMCVGVANDMLMVRVGPDEYEKVLSEAHVRPMDFTGRAMKGYVYVEPAGFKTEKNLKKWVDKGILFVKTLPPKKPKRN